MYFQPCYMYALKFRTIFRELMVAFPTAKVILTVRDPDTWYDSVKNSIYRGFVEATSFPTWHYNILSGQSTRIRMVEKLCCGSRYGFKGVFDIIHDGKEASVDYFNAWTKDVQNSVPPENLLIFNVKEGWKPICEFLDLPVPNLPFPRTNDSAAKNTQYNRRKFKAYVAILGIPILTSCAILYFKRKFFS